MDPELIHPPTNSGSRRWAVLTHVDVAALSDVLKEAFPRVVFFVQTRSYDKSTKPAVTCYPNLQSCPKLNVEIYLPEDEWKPSYSWSTRMERWDVKEGPLPLIWFYGSAKAVEGSILCDEAPPHLLDSYITMSYDMYSPDHMKIKAKVNRLFGKVMTSKTRRVTWPSKEEVKVRGDRVWAGFDALRWCRADDRRVLYFQCNGHTYGRNHHAWLPA